MLFYANVCSLKEVLCYKYFTEEEPLGIFFFFFHVFCSENWFCAVSLDYKPIPGGIHLAVVFKNNKSPQPSQTKETLRVT